MAEHAARDEHEKARRDQLLDLVEALRSRLPEDVLAESEQDLARVADRLELGLSHRVIALVGGTGSGKSSLFNAVTGLEVADVGVVRPTTSLPTACVWGSDATALLDHLGIPKERRHRGETALAGPSPGQLDGVVLLDVPDHDSVAAEHRDVVNRLVPLVDLLVWVLDPQKYADHKLHSDYLTALRGRQDGMLVVVNQLDTLTAEGLAELQVDVARLLVDEGLGEVEILSTSARSGEGIETLREAMKQTSQRASVNRTAVWDRLGVVASRVARALGPVPGPGLDVDVAARRLADALGVGAVADSLAAAVRGGTPVSSVREAPLTRMEAIRRDWFDQQSAGLAPTWRDTIDEVLPSAEAIRSAASEAVRAVPIPTVPRAGFLTRIRPAALARAADAERAGYRGRVEEALATQIRALLGPSRQVRDVLKDAHAVLADPGRPALVDD